MNEPLDPKRTVAELKELRRLTSDENGAQRIAFTKTWKAAREWLRAKLRELPAEVHVDEAGNLWATLGSRGQRSLVIGGHMDSVPNGGWLDGALNILAGLEIMRRVHAEHGASPPVTLRLVDWADEEGARFGKSLFGSSACAGTLDMDEARALRDSSGVSIAEALAVFGIDFERVKESGHELKDAAAYLELHIEQGPVLLDLDLPLGAVLGTYGVERHAVVFRGQAAHSGSTPMNRRKDAFLAAAKMSPEIYRIAERHGGVCTIGSCTTKPGIVTSVVEECRISLDQRHIDAAALGAMLRDAREASARFAADGGVSVSWERIWRIDPIVFDPALVALCGESIREVGAVVHNLPSGPLHDAAEVGRSGVPTAMMFVQSLRGISHNKLEDTREADLELCVKAFDRLAAKTFARIKAGL
jgi:hydantoinase/carbamoylase family amidase